MSGDSKLPSAVRDIHPTDNMHEHSPYTSLAAFLSDRRGNVVILFAFMTTVLFLFVGGAVDYSRWNAVRADMVESMDAASLAVAQLAANDESMTEADLKEYGKHFFEENFNYENHLKPGWDINFDLADNAVISTCITGDVDTYLLGVAGIDSLSIDDCVEITKKGSGRVELALVLDVTGSMGWTISGDTKNKIEHLKDAVEELLQVMYGDKTTSSNIKIGVVPFNAYVNPGAASTWSDAWSDMNADAVYHGARFIHVDENGNVDMSKKVNHFDLYNSLGDTDVEWEGCVEARPYPLDELDVAPGDSISASDLDDAIDIPGDVMGANPTDEDNTMYDAFDNAPSFTETDSVLTDPRNFKWVPMFSPDQPDCAGNWKGRCPAVDTTYSGGWWGGWHSTTEDWEVTVNFTENGASFSQYASSYWFSDPSVSPNYYSKNNYQSDSYISDSLYTAKNSGEPLGKYAKVVQDFRTLGGGGLDYNHIAWRDKMYDLGVDDFVGDATSLNDNDNANSDEYILRSAYVGWWNPSTQKYEGKYDLDTNIPSDSPNEQCPPAILPLTDSRTAIENKMNTLSPAGNTNSANGAVWGWRVLSHDAPFTEGVGPTDANYEDWQKAVVIMTDGENTTSSMDTHWGSALTAYGYAKEERMGQGVDTAGKMRDEIDNKLLRVCHRMKDEGYLVYTIMFGLNSSSAEKVFKACATKPTAPYFQNADNGADLEDAFGDIAADLVDLHISK